MRTSYDLLHALPAYFPTMTWVTFSPHSLVTVALVQHAKSSKESYSTSIEKNQSLTGKWQIPFGNAAAVLTQQFLKLDFRNVTNMLLQDAPK
jgi:hypothetical protein